MGGGVDAGEQDLARPQQGELTGLQLLHLGDEVGPGVDLLHSVHQLGPGLLVLPVLKAGLLAGPPLHQCGVAVGHDGGDLQGGGDGAVLAVFDVFQQSKYHNDSSKSLLPHVRDRSGNKKRPGAKGSGTLSAGGPLRPRSAAVFVFRPVWTALSFRMASEKSSPELVQSRPRRPLCRLRRIALSRF